MKVSVRSLLISFSVLLLLSATLIFLVFMYLTEQSPKEMANELYTGGKLFLYKHQMIKDLSASEMTRLYRSTCTRKCHSKDVIEKKPRTAPEWEWIVTRMKAPNRADISDHHAKAITRYLQEHFLSNIPTVLADETMRFIKRHLWKSDFGESDLYLDIIYLPREHLSLLPYLVASNSPPQNEGAYFIIYINTHQGTIPPWNLAEMATILDNNGDAQKAIAWKILYEDGQHHHKQGILTLPSIDESKTSVLEVTINLPGMKKRIFQWNRPIPLFAGNDHVEH